MLNLNSESDSSKLVTLFRVEDSRGRGLYGSYTCDQTEENASLWINAVESLLDVDETKTPMPHRDGMIDVPWAWYYAFDSIEQLKSWIYKSEWLVKMNELGGIIKMISVPKEFVFTGRSQVAYDPTEVVDCIDISLLEI